jgi:hypothetical protein
MVAGSLSLARFLDQEAAWPKQGRHILAQYDEKTVIVYQAYVPAIAEFALQHGYFGGPFSYSRMSWIKPNFLWMMYRSGWGTKPGQERTLAVRLKRSFFEALLSRAVESTFSAEHHGTRSDWEHAVAGSSVRLQWDPDHDPAGRPLPRRALQLGLRDSDLHAFGKTELVEIIDATEFVANQRQNAVQERWAQLLTPREIVYLPEDMDIRRRLALSEA